MPSGRQLTRKESVRRVEWGALNSPQPIPFSGSAISMNLIRDLGSEAFLLNFSALHQIVG